MRFWQWLGLALLPQCSQVDPHRAPLLLTPPGGPTALFSSADQGWYCYESNPIQPRFDASLDGSNQYTVCLRQNGPQEAAGIDIQLRGSIQAGEDRLCVLPALSQSTADGKPLTTAQDRENPFIYGCGPFSRSILEVSLTILPQDFNALYVLPNSDLPAFLQCIRQPITQNFYQSCPNFSYGKFK